MLQPTQVDKNGIRIALWHLWVSFYLAINMSKRILTGVFPENDYRYYLQHNDVDPKYGLPGKKKYPMPDRDHVMSAIRFFNYVGPSDEVELARNIIARIREYGIKDIHVGENNRFGKYFKNG